MPDKRTVTRRNSLKLFSAGGAALLPVGALWSGNGQQFASILDEAPSGPNSENGERITLKWKGHGDEHATQDCPEGSYAWWHFVLTRGGRVPNRDAKLWVKINGQKIGPISGEFRGEGEGAIHFHVYKESTGEPLTVEKAKVTFEGEEQNQRLVISEGDCVEVPPEVPPEVEEIYWQIDFGEGDEPPLPPAYWPNDVMCALGNEEDGVTENPSIRRQQLTGQLGDVTIHDESYIFDDEDDPSEVTVEFEVDEDAPMRDLHLAIFLLPGPFDEDEIEDQIYLDHVSDEFGPGPGSLTLSF